MTSFLISYELYHTEFQRKQGFEIKCIIADQFLSILGSHEYT